MTTVEADNRGIIVTGATVAEVYETTQSIIRRCGEIYTSFTTPVQQADGLFVSRGNVVLGEAI